MLAPALALPFPDANAPLLQTPTSTASVSRRRLYLQEPEDVGIQDLQLFFAFDIGFAGLGAMAGTDLRWQAMTGVEAQVLSFKLEMEDNRFRELPPCCNAFTQVGMSELRNVKPMN
ncbi:hypothetical protein CFC21_050119 [Triticum aestivum]|uniref:Uncharacterized protein n=2 Tax=Triticum aestivum TaxID=4565 RepID=A0A3B6H5Q1_WHEAT|nr:uncharacterized protein LOC123075654 [Triticum aestivum]KAF7040203.1 hypothetical protein CFC21_050119 [Triticum aestivum]